MKNLQDKIRGSLVGGAVGDAFGYPVEFVYSFNAIRSKYGEDGVTGYDTGYPWLGTGVRHDKALFSDDTQMTLYTAEGLLEAEKHNKAVVPTICNAYLVWYGHMMDKKVRVSYDSELSKIDELNQRRAPGHTCLAALAAINNGKEPMNSSKGCGGVMRVAPVGLYGASHGSSLEETARLAGEIAELTHLHPLSTYSSAALAVIVQLCVSAEDTIDKAAFKGIVERSLEVVSGVYGTDAPAIDDFQKLIRKALRLEDNMLRDWEVIENGLGGGWVAEETLAIAVFSVIRHINDFNACMICSVNHGGDSDSTGAVAGNISGAILGYNAIPEKFTKTIQLKDLLVSMADDLSKTVTIDVNNIVLPQSFSLHDDKTNMEENNLERFIEGQETFHADYELALAEVKKGRKLSHWIWYIFPQLRGLGQSRRSLYYGIADRQEAEDYLRHPVLGKRLREITNALLEHEGRYPQSIFGSIDAIKVQSCMTLFDCISPDDIFAEVLDVFYEGKRDPESLV